MDPRGSGTLAFQQAPDPPANRIFAWSISTSVTDAPYAAAIKARSIVAVGFVHGLDVAVIVALSLAVMEIDAHVSSRSGSCGY